jgi:DNA-binding GntR family transcriptional regulator
MASITRSVLSDQVKDHLLQEILAGHFAPGSRIVETRVARELGVSQAPVREALRDLEAVGIVEITAFQGARVRQPDNTELAEAYGIRAELESYGARLALPRLSDADVEELQGYIDEMQRAASAGASLMQAHVDATFHARVIEIAANTTLQRVWRYLEPMSRTYITVVTHRIDPHESADLHRPILDALRRRDADAATDAIHRHFRIASEMFGGLFVEEPPGAHITEPGPADHGEAHRAGRPHPSRRSVRATSGARHRSQEHT